MQNLLQNRFIIKFYNLENKLNNIQNIDFGNNINSIVQYKKNNQIYFQILLFSRFSNV